jgi:hypothetical protein
MPNALEAPRNVLDLPALLLAYLLPLRSAAWTQSFFALEFVDVRRDRKIFEVGEIAPSLAPFDPPQLELGLGLRHILGLDRLALQFLGELQQRLRYIRARLQLIAARPVVPLFVTFQLLLQPQVLQVEFLGAFGLPQDFHLQFMGAFILFVGSLLLLIPFDYQLTEQSFQ